MRGTVGENVELSGGNQQKVIVSARSFRGARVWLCDEPTIAIDVVPADRSTRCFAPVPWMGTHSDGLQRCAGTFEGCDRIAVLSQGRIRMCWKMIISVRRMYFRSVIKGRERNERRIETNGTVVVLGVVMVTFSVLQPRAFMTMAIVSVSRQISLLVITRLALPW
jgi:ABC-type sugar transport system ATPase subunit